MALSLRLAANRLQSSGGGAASGNSSGEVAAEAKAALWSLRVRYLTVFLLMKFADWLQGSYFYEVYAAKNDSRTGEAFTPSAISSLFLVGFCSAMVCGAFAGSWADKFGRKRASIVCSVVFMVQSLMVRSNTFEVLLLGRLLAGISSSMLHSVFEAWFVSEAIHLKAPQPWISESFSVQFFLDGIVAVVAGLVSQQVFSSFGGATAVFTLSAATLGVAGLLAALLWTENPSISSPRSPTSGATTESASPLGRMASAVRVVFSNPAVLAVGLVQSLFEGAMYSFVMVWAPFLKAVAVAEGQPSLPFGLVFASFMVCVMAGSSVFSMLSSSSLGGSVAPGHVLTGVLVLGAGALFLASGNASMLTVAAGFLVFEAACGVYFPCMSSLRSQVLPPQYSSTIMALFRVPLNLFVVTVLLSVETLGQQMVLLICSGSLLLGAVLTVTMIGGSAGKRVD